jgi:hypothetical protein
MRLFGEILMITTFLALALLTEAAVSAAPASANQPDPLDKVKCQRQIETGSLVKARKICRTVREWNSVADSARSDTDRLINRRGSSTKGN